MIGPAGSSPTEFIAASVRAECERAADAPRRASTLSAIRRAFHGEELRDFALDFDEPSVTVEYRHAIFDVRDELDCDGRISRAAAALLTHARMRGLAAG